MSGKKKVLVVDDDTAILGAIEAILQYGGYEVFTKEQPLGLEELEILPDLLLLDVYMRGYDGVAVCKAWKKHSLTGSIPVILVSASRDLSDSAQEAGANDYLPKPFEMTVLLEKVEKWTR